MLTRQHDHPGTPIVSMIALQELQTMNVFHLSRFNAYLRFHDIPGPGIPLVFLHGFGCASSCDFPRVAADPSLQSRRFLLVDLLGSGFSDHPASFSYTMDAHARCLIDLMSGLGIPSIDLYGHSMGGTIAIVTAALQPERIRSLIASEPALDPSRGPFSLRAAAQSEADYATRGHLEAVQAAIEADNPIWAGSLAASSPMAIHREAKSLIQGGTPSWREQLGSLPMPRTILFGERSLPDPDASKLAEAGMHVEVVPAAGHSMMWDNPSDLARAIQRALA